LRPDFFRADFFWGAVATYLLLLEHAETGHFLTQRALAVKEKEGKDSGK
jgi:hypothetical protein